jgi:exodeoxyribonuclease V gamma subunit
VPGHRDVRAADPGHVRRGEVVDDDDELERCRRGAPADLRVRLADRSLRQTNPVLGVVAQLLDLASSA